MTFTLLYSEDFLKVKKRSMFKKHGVKENVTTEFLSLK